MKKYCQNVMFIIVGEGGSVRCRRRASTEKYDPPFAMSLCEDCANGGSLLRKRTQAIIDKAKVNPRASGKTFTSRKKKGASHGR